MTKKNISDKITHTIVTKWHFFSIWIFHKKKANFCLYQFVEFDFYSFFIAMNYIIVINSTNSIFVFLFIITFPIMTYSYMCNSMKFLFLNRNSYDYFRFIIWLKKIFFFRWSNLIYFFSCFPPLRILSFFLCTPTHSPNDSVYFEIFQN